MQFRGGDENAELRSEPSQIPCPVFLDTQNPCDCACMRFAEIVKILNRNEALAIDYEIAVRRFIRAGSLQKDDTKGDTEVSSNEMNNSVERVYAQVQEALLKGSMMRCPDCKTPGLKDQACMHIVCRSPGCPNRVKWCYCCERRRGTGSSQDCRGCDAHSPYLQRQPGWESLSLNGESAGDAACFEFHRRRIRYFVQRIKHETVSLTWEAFRKNYPDILSNVPTEGRHISWAELDSREATMPPVFGTSTEADLAWKLPLLVPSARDVIENHQRLSARGNVEGGVREREPARDQDAVGAE